MQLSYIQKFSRVDKKKQIRLPMKMSEQLAEYIGILIGDGYISNNSNRGLIEIYGNSELDYNYFIKRLFYLYMILFNVKPILTKRNDMNVITFRVNSKGIFNFLKDIGLNIGPKSNISAPDIILNNVDLHVPFLRGVFDTDGSVALKKRHRDFNYYPTISVSLKSKSIIQQIYEMLSMLGFSPYVKYNDIRDDGTGNYHLINKLDINGKRNLDRWMDIIGFHNPKHIEKVKECEMIYKKLVKQYWRYK